MQYITVNNKVCIDHTLIAILYANFIVNSLNENSSTDPKKYKKKAVFIRNRPCSDFLTLSIFM